MFFEWCFVSGLVVAPWGFVGGYTWCRGGDSVVIVVVEDNSTIPLFLIVLCTKSDIDAVSFPRNSKVFDDSTIDLLTFRSRPSAYSNSHLISP